MTNKTERLSDREIARISSVPIFNPLQQATLSAANRTGIRIGIATERGVYHIEALAFALNNGRVTGSPDRRRLASFPVSDEGLAIAYLDGMAA